MNLATKLAIGVGSSIALASGIYYGTREPTRDIGVLSITDGAAHVLKVVKTKNGKQIRIVTEHEISGEEKDTEFGKAKLIEEAPEGGASVPGDAFCNILFFADVINENGRIRPDVDSLSSVLNAGVEPVLVSMEDADTGVWNCLFRGPDCVTAVEKLDYIGSDIHQFINHSKRHVFLKTHAQAGRTDKHGHAKSIVDIDDVDADPAGEVFVGHEWYGRPDLNFGSYKAGSIKSAIEVKNERKQVE